MIVIIAIFVFLLAVAVYLIRQAMDKARLERKLHFRRVEDAERQERMRESFDDTTQILPGPGKPA